MQKHMSKKANIIKNYLTGKLKCAEFAVTNTCIAQCSFCNIWKQQPKVFVDRENALTAIDRMADFGVSHLTLTGGEPLMHPDIIAFVERAASRNMHNAVLNAAPQLILRNDMPQRLQDAGADIVSISFDSGDPEVMAASRNIPRIMEQMKEAMEALKKTTLKTMASVLIWNDNYQNLQDVCERAQVMGFDLISLNYPTFSESDVYELGGEGINFSKAQVIEGLESSIAIKRTKRYNIINSAISMDNIIRYIKDPRSVKYQCFGGRRVLFVDWFLDVRPCMQLPDKLGNMLTMKEEDLFIPPCNQCNMSWYRDFSAMFHGARSLPILWEMFRDSSGVI
jgi:MoaA/NifB/PqqE/SkfB family radical SAM enzyme